MNYTDLQDRLSNLGLTKREAKVYLALINNNGGSAASLQRMVGIHRTKIYEVLKSLSYKGLCSEKRIDNLINYEAVSPKIALSQFITAIKDNLSDAERLSEELQAIYSKGEKQTEPFEYLEVIHGNETIHHKYISLLKSTDKELLSFTRPPFATNSPDMDKEQFDEFYAFRERGGKSRWIRELGANPDRYEIEISEIADKKGEEFRISDKLPVKMMIFDREILLLADEGKLAREGELSMSIIKQQTMVNGYVALFDFFWSQSITFKEWKKQNPQFFTELDNKASNTGMNRRKR